MSFLFIFLGIFILILIIYYTNQSYDCFTNYTPEQLQTLTTNEINNIKNDYNDIKLLHFNNVPKDDMRILQKKANIKNSFDNIEKLLITDKDKYLLTNNYYDINRYLDNFNDDEFNKTINNINNIITNAINDNTYKTNTVINEINADFASLNDIYKSIYIDKKYNYETHKEDINYINKKIIANLLKITIYSNINSSGIDTILNITLKQAYETNNLLEINNNKNSFKDFLNKFSISITPISYEKPQEPKITQTPINVYESKFSIEIIKKDFNNIYNSFQIINNIYKNKKFTFNTFIANLNNIIYTAIDNISNYYQYNNEYKNKIIAIKNTIISSILDKELKNSYLQDDIIKINNLNIDFFNNINEIKNIIINTTNNNLCLTNIIDQLFNNKHPITINKIQYCDKI